jgi:hypothetical protein
MPRKSHQRSKEIWSTCYWCRNNFCTVRRIHGGKFRGPEKFCSYRCENRSRRWDGIAVAGGLTRSKHAGTLKYSVSTAGNLCYPCGHERTPENTYSNADRRWCLLCRRNRDRKRMQIKAEKMKEAA